MFSLVFIDIFPRGEGSRSRLRHFALFVFSRSSLGALGTIWELFWCLWGSPWGPLGRLGSSLVTLGGYFGLTLLYFGPLGHHLGELWQRL